MATKQDLDSLGRRFGTLQVQDGVALWHWAQALRAIYLAQRTDLRRRLTLAEIGVGVGLAARGKRFQVAWVSRVLRAARDWPAPPCTQRDAVEFVRRFHGNAPATRGAARAAAQLVQRALRRLVRAVADALALGCPTAQIQSCLATALGGPVKAPSDAAPQGLKSEPANEVEP